MRPFPPSTTPGCAAFISAMLTRDPDARPSAAALFAHPFLAGHMAAAGIPPPPPPLLRASSNDQADLAMHTSRAASGVVAEVSLAGSWRAAAAPAEAMGSQPARPADALVTLYGTGGSASRKGGHAPGPDTPRSPLEAEPSASGSSGSSGWSTCGMSGRMYATHEMCFTLHTRKSFYFRGCSLLDVANEEQPVRNAREMCILPCTALPTCCQSMMGCKNPWLWHMSIKVPVEHRQRCGLLQPESGAVQLSAPLSACNLTDS